MLKHIVFWYSDYIRWKGEEESYEGAVCADVPRRRLTSAKLRPQALAQEPAAALACGVVAGDCAGAGLMDLGQRWRCQLSYPGIRNKM